MKVNRRADDWLRDDRAVTDVLGSILLVGITIGMAVGLGILLMSADGPRDRVHADVRITLSPGGPSWGDGDEEIQLRHLGGESFRTDDAEVRISIDGTETVYQGAALDQGFADGAFRIGDSWTVVLNVAVNSTVDVRLIDTEARDVVGSAAVIASPAVASGKPAIVTYVESIAVATGSLADEDHAKSADDGGDAATLEEATIPGGAAADTRLSGTVVSSTGTGSPTGAQSAGDGQWAVVDDAGDQVTVGGFTAPGDVGDIDAVTIGLIGRSSGGGANDPVLDLSYTVPAGGSVASSTVGAEAEYTSDVTADRAWTVADVESMQVRVERQSASPSFRDAEIDHVFVHIHYTTADATDLEATLIWDITAPGRTTHQLQLRYVATEETFELQVKDDVGDWTARGILTSTTGSVFTYTLEADEYLAGVPEVRIVDRDTGATAGRIEIDYARVWST